MSIAWSDRYTGYVSLVRWMLLQNHLESCDGSDYLDLSGEAKSPPREFSSLTSEVELNV